MKTLLSAAALAIAVTVAGAAAPASAAPTGHPAISHERTDSAATDFSAQRRYYHGGPRYRYGYGGGYRHYRPHYYARPYGYRPYGYARPYGYGPSVSFGFGPRYGW
jgi:hypothetical protein